MHGSCGVSFLLSRILPFGKQHMYTLFSNHTKLRLLQQYTVFLMSKFLLPQLNLCLRELSVKFGGVSFMQ